MTWSVISDDLTSNNPDVQTYTSSGGLTSDVTAAENYTSIVAVTASKLQRGVIWVGSDDGRVHVTRDGGQNWNRIDTRARGVPAGAWVPMITASPHEAGTAFVVFDDHRRGDMTPYIYRTEDFGARWTRLSGEDISGYALSVLQDSVNPDLLFAGTELGLFLSLDGGDSWSKFTSGVPTVSVMDMAIQERENDLVLGTHGRSVIVIDDYSVLRQISEEDFDTRLAALTASPGQQYATNPTSSTRFTGNGEYRGPNEPYGVMVTFIASGDDLPHPDKDKERARKITNRLAAGKAAEEKVDEEDENSKDKPPRITVKVSNAGGEVIRTFKHPVHQGLNRLTWGMQSDGIRPAPGSDRNDDDNGLPPGTQVLPGNYRIELTLGDDTSAIDATVLADPRYDLSSDQRQANYEARQALMALSEASVTALERIDQARNDVATITKLIENRPDAKEDETLKELKKQATEVKKGLDGLEKIFRTPPETKGIVFDDDKVSSGIGMASFYVGSAAHAPSPTADVYVEIARNMLEEGLSRVNEFMVNEVADLRTAVDKAGISLLQAPEPVVMPD
jgi:hypothetical protein